MSQEFTISSGPLPGSEKIYVKGEMFDIEVPMRRINLTPTVDTDGTKIETEACRGLRYIGTLTRTRTTRWTCTRDCPRSGNNGSPTGMTP